MFTDDESRYIIKIGDCRSVVETLFDNSVDAIVCDPPYELGFMGKSWDSTGVAYDTGLWRQMLRVLKPGGHLLAFGGSRTYHRLACAIEDAGFEIRDQIMWVYGSGFPKSLDVSKAIDNAAGAVREDREVKHGGTNKVFSPSSHVVNKGTPATDEAKRWSGWGTALKPAHEPIVMARKPLDGTVANNVVTHGVGGINIDGCRVGEGGQGKWAQPRGGIWTTDPDAKHEMTVNDQGRFPANFIHDGSDEVLDLFPNAKGGVYPARRGNSVNTDFASGQETVGGARVMGDDGSAARFFYCAKASKKDRNEGLEGLPKKKADTRSDVAAGIWTNMSAPHQNHHPTVKPTELMRYLTRLVTPVGGTVLDPFCGSGSTGKAAMLEGFRFVGIERDEEYARIAETRIRHALGVSEPTP